MTKRIIPCLDIRDGRVVKGRRFQDIQNVADPIELARYYCEEGADELVFYDIAASFEKRGIMLDLAKQVADVIDIPFTMGGGLTTIDDIRAALENGADKVSINSPAIDNPNLIKEAKDTFGRQCVMLAIDARRVGEGQWEVIARGARDATGMDVIEWAKRGVELGAGEICINSIDEDGVRSGYDIPLNQALAQAVDVPIIASGGAGTMQHFADVLDVGADAALAASVFHYKDIRIPELKAFLKAQNIDVRG